MDCKQCNQASKAQYLIIQQYFDKVVKSWGDEGVSGNNYKIAHFDGVTALARDLGVITLDQCEFWRQELRRATCIDRGVKPSETAVAVAERWVNQ